MRVRDETVAGLFAGLLVLNSVGTARAGDDVIFYEGNNCTQDRLFAYDSRKRWSDNCDAGGRTSRCRNNNDEARSVLITNGSKRPLRVAVYDSPSRKTYKEDWTEIYVPRTTGRSICIGSFERIAPSNIPYGDVTFNHHHWNGLDGKVSFISIR